MSVGQSYSNDITLEKVEDKDTGKAIYDEDEFDNKYRFD